MHLEDKNIEVNDKGYSSCHAQGYNCRNYNVQPTICPLTFVWVMDM